jgi:ABC-type transporter Mla subunit MlaD
VVNAANATLDVQTDLKVKNASFAEIKTTKLTAGKNLTIEAGANDIATAANASYEFGDDSTLIYSFNTSTADKKIDLKADIKNNIGGAADEGFNLIFRATGANTFNINGVVRCDYWNKQCKSCERAEIRR